MRVIIEECFYTVNNILSTLNEFIMKIFMGDNVYISKMMFMF